jgi:hypothetical protein
MKGNAMYSSGILLEEIRKTIKIVNLAGIKVKVQTRDIRTTNRSFPMFGNFVGGSE